MKNNWKKTSGVILLATIMLTGLNLETLGQGGRGQGPCGKGFGPGPYPQQCRLDLTEEQQEEMKTLRMEHYKAMKPFKNKMAELKAREKTLLSEEKVDMKAVNSVIDEQTGLINKMRKLQVEQKLKMREILTEDQIMMLEQRNGCAKRGPRA